MFLNSNECFSETNFKESDWGVRNDTLKILHLHVQQMLSTFGATNAIERLQRMVSNKDVEFKNFVDYNYQNSEKRDFVFDDISNWRKTSIPFSILTMYEFIIFTVMNSSVWIPHRLERSRRSIPLTPSSDDLQQQQQQEVMDETSIISEIPQVRTSNVDETSIIKEVPENLRFLLSLVKKKFQERDMTPFLLILYQVVHLTL